MATGSDSAAAQTPTWCRVLPPLRVLPESWLNTRHRSRFMNRSLARLTVAGLTTIAVAACSDATGSSASALSAAALSAALGSVPIGFGELTSSFVGVSADDAPSAGLWLGGGREARFDHGDFMGGGIQDAFVGGVAFDGRGGHRGPFGGRFAG